VVGGAFRLGSFWNSTFRRAAEKSDKLSRAYCQLSSRGAAAFSGISAFQIFAFEGAVPQLSASETRGSVAILEKAGPDFAALNPG
jgi:hypothetical protein